MDNDPFSPASVSDNGAFTDDTRPVVDPNVNYLEALVGEGKKFRTHEDLARGKAESDAFIATLLREKKEAMEELQKRLTVEDLLSKLEEKNNGTRQTMNQKPDQFSTNGQGGDYGHDAPNGNSQLDLESIKAAIKKDLEQEQILKKQEQNFAEVQEKLKATYGDKANAVLQAKAQELGITLDKLRDIAKESPKLLFATLGQPEPRLRDDVFSPPKSGVNSVAHSGSQSYGEWKPLSYWQNLKKTDPKKYFSPEVSVEMHKHGLKLGADFFDI